MLSHEIFHFAGHGISDPSDPAQSSLIFEKANASSISLVQDRLHVQRLFDVDLQPALLAFLSACSITQNRNKRLVDDSIHIRSGFLVAGFQHVIGCLWASSDEECVDVARDFLSRVEHQQQ